MDVLDLPTHQLILLDLASNLAEGAHQDKLAPGDYNNIFSTGATSAKASNELSASSARTQIALASFAASISTAKNASDEHLGPVLQQLIYVVEQFAPLKIEEQLNFGDWPVADQVSYALTTSLLRIATNAPTYRNSCIRTMISYVAKLANILGSEGADAHLISSCIVPKYHGLYRALSNTPFAWSLDEFAKLATVVSGLTSSVHIIRRLNDSMLILPDQKIAAEQASRATRRKPKKATIRPRDDDDDARSEGSVDTFFSGDEEQDDGVEEDVLGRFVENEDVDALNYRRATLSHYRRFGRPLSGHLVIALTVECLSTALSQALAIFARPPPPAPAPTENGSDPRVKTDDTLMKDVNGQKKSSDQKGGERETASQAERFDLDSIDGIQGETGTTRKAWKALLNYAVKIKDATVNGVTSNGSGAAPSLLSVFPGMSNKSAAFGESNFSSGVATAMHLAGRMFHDLQRFVESEGLKSGELLIDVYALEILSESLKLSALASVAQSQMTGAAVDGHTLVRIRTLLSESAFVYEPLVQSAALQSTTFLVRNFPNLAMPMTTQLRRFASAPLSMFELTVGKQAVPSPVLASAARCLATCVTLRQSDDLAVSTIYTLLNTLGGQSGLSSQQVGGMAARAASVRSGLSRAVTGRDFSSAGTINGGRSEEQKRLTNTNIVAIVSRLALEVGKKDVIALTISLLLQRVRTSDEATEAAILNNVVPLALAGPKQSFIDVIRAFSQTSRNAMQGGAGRSSESTVQYAQLRLATGLGKLNESDPRDQPKEKEEKGEKGADGEKAGQAEEEGARSGRKELYVIEILQLFAEKGMQLQGLTVAGRIAGAEEAELKADLQGLVPILSTTLSHADYNPQMTPTTEMVSLFRSFWFIAVIFGLSTPQQRPSRSATGASSPLADSLGIIAMKTPTLVAEQANNYLESDLQYNSVLKREYSVAALENQRRVLSTLIPSHVKEISALAFPQATFLSTIFNLESMRASMGMPTMTLWYFVNEGLNNSALVGPMEAIADTVIGSYIQDLAIQTNDHSLDSRVTSEVKNLLLGACHRVAKVRSVSLRFFDRLISAYPSLLCDQEVVVCMLEILTLLRQGCEGQYKDEYYPVYHFKSERAKIEFDLTDSYSQRNDICMQFLARTRSSMRLLLSRAPVELHGILQRYLSSFDEHNLPLSTELGKSVAIEFASALPSAGVQDAFLPNLGGWNTDQSSAFVNEITAKSTYRGEMGGVHLALRKGLSEMQKDPHTQYSGDNVKDVKSQLETVSLGLSSKPIKNISFGELRRLLYRSAALVVGLPKPDYDLLHHIVAIPLKVLTPSAITTACHVWSWIIGERPIVETKIMVEISLGWGRTIKARRGLFSKALTSKHPLVQKTEMTPSDRVAITKERERANRQFTPHLTLIHLVSSRFEAVRNRDPAMVVAIVRMLQRSAAANHLMSTHALSREVRLALVLFGLRVIQNSRLDGLLEFHMRNNMYKLAFEWFTVSPQWSFGSNRLQIASEMQILSELNEVIKRDQYRAQYVITSFPPSIEAVRLPGHLDVSGVSTLFAQRRRLLQLLVEDELGRLSVWANPLQESSRGKDFTGEVVSKLDDAGWTQMVQLAWTVSPAVAVEMTRRFKNPAVRAEAGRLVRTQPLKVIGCSDALSLFVDDHLALATKENVDLHWLLYWSAVTPIDAILLFQPEFKNHPFLLQYAMRALEQHPVDLTFFYVPQIVQALRDDRYGYVEQFIFETSKISQLFCHQIIWNMKANSYKDDDAEEEDPMKPTLDRMTDLIVAALSGDAQNFYQKEFQFFDEVTGISGKLKAVLKKSKAEKKAKIDEEVGKIKVEEGVYLPSNPDGTVVDIARKSGRPLQSHAKTPFMATFKVHREVEPDDGDPSSGQNTAGEDNEIDTQNNKVGKDVWQSAIFKVGDDCRQDVLILQTLCMMKNIWQTVGLDLYVFPYRVTATGPGMGVIDVVPNATSRDEMGRAQVNNLRSWYISQFGNMDSIAYQQARNNFIKSFAGYSLACHLYQLRDRHGGNIMFTGDGQMVQIDFGFAFTIGPGGMKFEPYSFKFNHEFSQILGGKNSEGYKMFSELFVKGFLALRAYSNELIASSRLMLGSDLPCFKGLPTFDELRDRFVPHLDERKAAQHAMALIEDAHENRRADLYDYFQYLQNKIPVPSSKVT